MKKLSPWMMNVATLVVIGLFLVVQGVWAQRDTAPADTLAPSSTLVSYQGTLTDSLGNPVNATVTMKFALYDASSGGTLKWGPETQTVQVTNGLFHVLLGSVTPITPVTLTGDLWLDIIVNNEQLVPREALVSVAYAMQASNLAADARALGDLDMGNHSIYTIDVLRAPLNRWLTVAADSENYSNGWPKGGRIWLASVSQDYWTGLRGSVLIDIVKDLAVGNSPSFKVNRIQSDGTSEQLLALDQSGNLQVARNMTANGRGFFGGATSAEGAMNLQDIAVPLTFKESGATGQGSLWRVPLHNNFMRFDSSDNGMDFTSYHSPLQLYNDGSIGCGAITESNLQTEEERTAGGSDRFEQGDVLCWAGERLEKCAAANDRLVQAVADKSGRPIVIGAEPVKVLGPVRYGDLLVASEVPGYAMVNNDPRVGTVIAQALDDFDGEQGIIKAMVRKF